MKYYISLLLFSLTSSFVQAQEIVKMSAVKGNNYGVAYSLPKTSITIKAFYTKKTYKAGDFYRYAERYLSISKPITQNSVEYTLEKIETSTKGILDKDHTYLLEFRPNTTAPFVSLSRDGLICAINADCVLPAKEATTKEVVEKQPVLPDPYSFLTEEVLAAGSTNKQAELIAKQIYRLREAKVEILAGEAENMPPDGEAYKLVISKIEEQEKALTSLFTGTEVTETGQSSFDIVPEEESIVDMILFRFSSKLGVVGENDLAGAPVYVSVIKEFRPEPVLSDKEMKLMNEKFSKGIIYNIPDKADFKIIYNGQTLINRQYDIVQFGVQEVLAPKMFENSKKPIKVIFNFETGGIKQIIE